MSLLAIDAAEIRPGEEAATNAATGAAHPPKRLAARSARVITTSAPTAVLTARADCSTNQY
jgi:hypothetical protein